MKLHSRRAVLRGVVGGAVVGVGLPLLDCFLNDNGTALASGAPLPVRFGTWFWGCGVNVKVWAPDKVGADYDIKPQLEPIRAYRDKVTVLSGFNALLGGQANYAHWSGCTAVRAGVSASANNVMDAPSIDMLVANAIGTRTRFKSLEVACTGNPRTSYSSPAPNVINPSEVDPMALYKRLFGADFRDPNAANFVPDGATLARRSVLSGIKEQRDAWMKSVGSKDRARLDQYFTSVRQLEGQLDLMLQKPEPLQACRVPKAPEEIAIGTEVETARRTHDAMVQLIGLALACDQTRVFNVAFSEGFSTLRTPGSSMTHHQITHEDLIDEKLGYQPRAAFFVDESMKAFGQMLKTFESIPEGGGTLLDNMLVLANSDTQFAKVHSVDALPVMVAGRGGGKWRSGLHIAGHGDPASRIGLTLQQALGMPVGKWGGRAEVTSKTLSECIV